MQIRLIILSIAVLIASAHQVASAQRPTRFLNEQSDTTRLTEILVDLSNAHISDPNTLIAEAGRKMLNTPYAAATLEHTPEMTTISLDSLDCTTFVDNAVAMALTIESNRNSWQDFVFNLERIRYKDGTLTGYGSRLHYISDWIVDNSHRGILREVTDRIANARYEIKTLDFMTSHRNLYPAMADDNTFQTIKDREIGYRSHRYPVIRTSDIRNADIKEGDIIAIATSTKGLDVSHMGIAVMINGVPHLMHASSKEKRVIIDQLPLSEYVRRNRSAIGIRVVRIR